MNYTYQIKFFPPKDTIFLNDEIKRYQSLGFTIKDVIDTPFHEVTFPTGWGLGGFQVFHGIAIHDQKGRHRGWISFTSYHMGLYNRYMIGGIQKRKEQKFIVIFDRAKNKIVYQIGRYYDIYDEYILLGQARNYLDENYPDWEKFDAYWD